MAAGLCLFGASIHAQPIEQIDAQERRLLLERERTLRQQQEQTPDIRLQGDALVDAARLPINETPCFAIHTVRLDGEGDTGQRFNWLLDTLAGPQADDSPIGHCVGARGISRLINRAQNALTARGFITSRILAQPQDLNGGVLTLTVLPGRLRAVRFAPGAVGAAARHAVPAAPGEILNLRDVEQALENFKRVPTAEVDIQIEPGELPGQSDVVVSYKQAFPLRLSFSADDSGSRGTGKYQGAVTVSADNPSGLNDLLYVSFNRNLGAGQGGERGTRGRTVHYSVPFGYWLLSATAGHNRYWQTIAGLSQSYVYRGTSRSAEMKVSRLVWRDAVRKTTLSLSAFGRTSNNFIDDTEIEVQKRKVGGWQAALNHREFIGPSTVDMTLAYKRGTGAFGSLPAPEETFGEGTSRFKLVTFDLGLAMPFQIAAQKLNYSSILRAQFNRTPLTPQDRFAIGGRYTVRGFDGERSLSADRGWLLRNEVGVALGHSGQQAYVGIDHGRVSGPSSQLLLGRTLAGGVLGLRGSVHQLHYDIFAGGPLHKPAGFETARVTAGFSLNYSF